MRAAGPTAARPPARRSWRHLAAAAVLLLPIGAMLEVFVYVVRDAVHQGTLRKEATARHSFATWQCSFSRTLSQRDICLGQLNAAAPTVALRSAP